MPKYTKETQRKSSAVPYKKEKYDCRICHRSHALRSCQRFLEMKMADRLEAVRRHSYCFNCLAHDHLVVSCSSSHRCHHCKKSHHTLLHVDPKLRDALLKSDRKQSRPNTPERKSKDSCPPRDFSPSPSSKQRTSLSAILRQNSIVLLPTVLVKVKGKSERSTARCLLDSGSPVSRISKRLVDSLALTTLSLKEETICPLRLTSRFDETVTIEGTFRVSNRISTVTPAESLPESFKRHFPHLFFADSKFFKSAPVDIVIGVDLYPRVIAEGVYAQNGLPTARSTIFGWVIYGVCSH
ncbi:uncharacterized protein LOC131997864 [Stomoxys calcitrans]|uniref:uncharacterized protein LOC131997864 n=1 Tax=Stomoxys calcitrans TaxID=35570 RepID=UPI0027E2D9AB|nr:uncharacterized protein LOC131997864 [Stomoxys calcitrans]